MDVILTLDQERLVADAVAVGRFQRPEDVVREALTLWERRERELAAFRVDLDRIEASMAAGDARPVKEESMRELVDSVKRRGRERLAEKAARQG
ncbi:ribbon-helix-helix domain-containing protein [Acidisoma silvae]|uniref:Type II toxin-antitoxin system ParD family antitoxin n=1 Tax=Acidisoma silvae TaxID=2802396 RepID=A0A963YPD6_9PROT|nr:type II toxin-antitoxin system ParD family antitoxin [Acidisoma silvae]MCB8874272.1 type II toxin-antitoxin system ParD family antitoxin [Acidisoma silvae]